MNIIGIDVGGTKIAAGVASLPSGEVKFRRIIPALPQRGGDAVLEAAGALAESVAADAQEAGLTIQAIGLGLCELVDPHGRILSHNCITWREEDVRRRFSHLPPLTLEADVRAAAQAEALLAPAVHIEFFYMSPLAPGSAPV